MSWTATAWAKKVRGVGPIEKLVLLILAEYANPEDDNAWPTQATLAEDCSLSTRSIRSITKKLSDKRLLDLTQKGNQYQPTIYHLRCAPEECSHAKHGTEHRNLATSQPALEMEDVSKLEAEHRNLAKSVPEADDSAPEADDSAPEAPHLTNRQEPTRTDNVPSLNSASQNLETATTEPVLAFLQAESGQQATARFIDLAATVGLRLPKKKGQVDGGKVAGLVRKYGHGNNVVHALWEALEKQNSASGIGDCLEYMTATLGGRNGSGVGAGRNGRPGSGASRGVARSLSAADLERYEQYATGEIDSLSGDA